MLIGNTNIMNGYDANKSAIAAAIGIIIMLIIIGFVSDFSTPERTVDDIELDTTSEYDEM
jgi:hypothetical protein